jgi:nitrite reductase/ring-hydroxylating ferredoxin subunit
MRLIKLELCHVSAVEEGQALKVEKSGLTLAVFNISGEYFVTDDLCTHGPGSLSESYILDDVVECNFHNGAFNIKTGEVVSAPCTENLKTYPVKIINHHICIDVS